MAANVGEGDTRSGWHGCNGSFAADTEAAAVSEHAAREKQRQSHHSPYRCGCQVLPRAFIRVGKISARLRVDATSAFLMKGSNIL